MPLSRRAFCLRSAIALTAVGTVFGAHAKGKDDDDKGKGKDKDKKPKNDPTGTYKIEVRGYLTGSDGTATVSAAGIVIEGTNVKDENGRRGTIKLPLTKISKNRFTGQGTAMNMKITINGRIDPPTGAVKVGRITATYAMQNSRYGRVSGEQQ